MRWDYGKIYKEIRKSKSGFTSKRETEIYISNLRTELRNAGVQFAVVKNSILSRAAKEAGLEGMDDIFKGPSAVAFSNDDVVAPAKILADFAKKVEAFKHRRRCG